MTDPSRTESVYRTMSIIECVGMDFAELASAANSAASNIVRLNAMLTCIGLDEVDRLDCVERQRLPSDI